MVPVSRPQRGTPFAPRGPGGPVPPLHHYYGALRPPSVPLAVLRDRTAIPPLRPVCSQRPGRTAVGSGELVFRFPSRIMSVETNGSPRFLGIPGDHCPCSFDPGRIRRVLWDQVQQHLTRPPLMSTTKAPSVLRFRGSITRPLTSLSTLRRVGCPTTTQDSFLAAGPALPGGIRTRRDSMKGF